MMETEFRCRNGRIVIIKIDDEQSFLSMVFDEVGNKLGQLEFSEIDGCLKLIWAYLDQLDPSWCRQGIGREILRNVKDWSGYPIIASENDGTKQNDGSHLTGDAPAFVGKMKDEGLIEPGIYDRFD